MIVSYSYKYIYVRAPRTGSCSTLVKLFEHTDEHDIVAHANNNPRLPEEHLVTHIGSHAAAKKIRRMYPNAFKEFLVFAVARPPWDRWLSRWGHYLRRGQATVEDGFLDHLMMSAGDEGWDLSTHDWKHFVHQMTDNKGNIIVDRIINYAMLQEGLKQVLGELNHPYEEVPRSHHVSARQDLFGDATWRDIMTDEEQEAVIQLHRSEIEKFNWLDFDTSPEMQKQVLLYEQHND